MSNRTSQILSAVAAALLVALGVAVKFSPPIPAAAVPWLGAIAAIGGALATRLLPPFVPQMLQAWPRFGKVLSQITGSVLAVLAFAPLLPVKQPGLASWIAFASALIGAVGSALLPHEPVAAQGLTGSADELAKIRQGGFVRLGMLPILIIAGAAVLCALGCATQDFVNGGRKTLTIAAQAQADGISAFVKYDAIHQEAIATKDEPVDVRKAELATYRASRAKVMDAVDALGSVTSAAAKQLDAIEAGAAKSTDFVPYLAAVISAGTALHDVLAAIGVDLPVLDNLLDKPTVPPLPAPPLKSKSFAPAVA